MSQWCLGDWVLLHDLYRAWYLPNTQFLNGHERVLLPFNIFGIITITMVVLFLGAVRNGPRCYPPVFRFDEYTHCPG